MFLLLHVYVYGITYEMRALDKGRVHPQFEVLLMEPLRKWLYIALRGYGHLFGEDHGLSGLLFCSFFLEGGNRGLHAHVKELLQGKSLKIRGSYLASNK